MPPAHHWTVILLGVALLLGVGLAAWHWHSRQTLPRIARWVIYIAPLPFMLAALLVHFVGSLSRDDTGVSHVLTAIFGVASVLSLGLSLAVLVSVRETLHGEVELMTTATDLIQSARKKLVFLVLTPNLGYPRASYKRELKLMDRFRQALVRKLSELLSLAEGEGVEVKIATLRDDDLERFFEMKQSSLEGGDSEGEREAARAYRHNTDDLLEDFRREIQKGLQRGHSLCYRRWKATCIQWLVTEAPSTKPGSDPAPQKRLITASPGPDFPPLNLLIVDTHAAMVFYNQPMLTAQPVDLRGRVVRLPEEIEAFALLVDSYLDRYCESVEA